MKIQLQLQTHILNENTITNETKMDNRLTIAQVLLVTVALHKNKLRSNCNCRFGFILDKHWGTTAEKNVIPNPSTNGRRKENPF